MGAADRPVKWVLAKPSAAAIAASAQATAP
jgi:hypothetical protein